MAAEEASTFGQRYELFACMQCGKCTGSCPVAFRYHLNVRRLIQEGLVSGEIDVDTAFAKKELWSCTTCATCKSRCPKGVTPFNAIMGMRGVLVESGKVPTTIRDALKGTEKHGNPWGRARPKRTEWTLGLTPKVKNIAEEPAENLLFVCCAAAYDPRVQEVAKAFVKIFNSAQFDFGILGNDESCCGSEIKRMGEQGLFEVLGDMNKELFESVEVKNVVTISPHCFNALKNEYKEPKFATKHYSQAMAELIDQGKLKFSKEIKKVVAYHDPCFLGRQNQIFDEPRKVIQSIPGVEFRELERIKEFSLCCEGGGGRMWVEAEVGVGPNGERLAETRIKEAIGVGAEILAVACPFCLLTLEDAVKTSGNEGKIKVMDILELAAEAL
jgi:Fe-S oxidoreductase